MWQAIHEELSPLGLTVVTVALDLDPEKARTWIEAANPTHPSLVDRHHRVDELLGITNVPMAVWIDETGTLVRPAEAASIQPSPFAALEITDEMPERLQAVLREFKQMPETGPAYRAAIVDWATKGADSRFAMSPDDVIAASQPRSAEHSRAAACFELGIHAEERGDHAAAMAWWKQAHELHPENWTYKRQAWTLESTPEGADSDKAQEVQDTYGTSWTDEFLRVGGVNYTVFPKL